MDRTEEGSTGPADHSYVLTGFAAAAKRAATSNVRGPGWAEGNAVDPGATTMTGRTQPLVRSQASMRVQVGDFRGSSPSPSPSPVSSLPEHGRRAGVAVGSHHRVGAHEHLAGFGVDGAWDARRRREAPGGGCNQPSLAVHGGSWGGTEIWENGWRRRGIRVSGRRCSRGRKKVVLDTGHPKI